MTSFFRKLGARLGLWVVVYTEDFDGEVRTRIVRESPFGGGYVYGLHGCARLLSDGKTSGCSYIDRWMEYPGNLNHVEFPTELRRAA